MIMQMKGPAPKPVVWLGETLATLRTCPQEVQDEVGYALYLAQIGEKYFVLHVFQKKSTKGVRTPQSEIELVRQRLKRATELHGQREH